MMYTAQLPNMGTFVIRYPRGRGSLTEWRCKLESIPVGKGRLLREGTDVALLTLGPIGKSVAAVCDDAAKEGISVAHYDMRFLKPLDEEILHEVGRKYKHVITLENGTIKGGLGSAVLEFMAEHGYKPDVHLMGLPDQFIEHGSVPELCRLCEIDAESIVREIVKRCE